MKRFWTLATAAQYFGLSKRTLGRRVEGAATLRPARLGTRDIYVFGPHEMAIIAGIVSPRGKRGRPRGAANV